jgi:hypothetical protein
MDVRCLPFTTADAIVRLMRTRKLLSILGTLFLTAALYAAANVTGTWNATVDLGGGQGGTPTFALKQDGEKLTGTYKGALGDAQIAGSVKGEKVAFDFSVQGTKIHYEGTVNAGGTEMHGTCDYGGQASGTFKATKGENKK